MTKMTTTDDLLEIESHARRLVWEIRDLYHELPDTIAAISGLHAICYDRGAPTKKRTTLADTPIIGGDALVMAGPGSTETSITRTAGERIDWALAEAEQHDAPSVLAVLTKWEDTWRTAQGHPAATTTSVKAAATYLTTHTAWAIRDFPDIDSYLDELTTLRGRLRVVTGHINPPKPSDAPCIDCNGQIVQRYRTNTTRPEDAGLDDIRECNRCGTTYTPAQYALAVQNRLEEVRNDPDRLLTAAEARVLWRLSEKQIYTWEYRDQLAPAGRDPKGRKLYRNGDIAGLKKGRVA